MSKTSSPYLSIDKSLKLLLKSITIPNRVENIPTYQALGRVLKDDVLARTNTPEYNTSHMDGFAIRSKDVVNASITNPVYLKISEYESILGHIPMHVLPKGNACRIQTGSNLPLGSDVIVPIEDTKIIDNEKIQIDKPLKAGNFVYLTGSDIKKGSKMMDKQQLIRAQHIGLLATLQISKVSVYTKPIVSIIPTGNELTDNIEESKSQDSQKIINTNSHVLSCLISELGGIPMDFGITPDDPLILKRKIKKALNSSDLLLTTGGTSAGKYDVVKSTIEHMGDPGLIARRVKLDRGRVAGIASLNQKPIIILPGPIQGALNAFFVFATPLISLFSGKNNIEQFSLDATLTDDWTGRKKFHDFTKILYIRLSYSKSKETLFAKPITGETQSVSMISESNAFVIIPETVTELFEGDEVKANLLPGFSYISDIVLLE